MHFDASVFPFTFWIAVVTLVGGAWYGYKTIHAGIGIPIIAVIVTVATWYVGDAIYNDYANFHAKVFPPSVLDRAWLQVAWFVITFLLLVRPVHERMNARLLRFSSGTVRMFSCGVDNPALQRQFEQLFKGCVSIWVVISIFAALRLQGEIIYYFFPFLGYKAEPWGRARIGSGFDAIFTLAFYFQLLVAGIFGVIAALSTNRRVRACAIGFCLVSWPYFIFDRTRNTMLAAVIPGVVTWCLLRITGGWLKKAAALAACFIIVNAWMEFVIANRSEMAITDAFKSKGFSLTNKEKSRHEGLNMYEELCWITRFLDEGTYSINWGARYFAEAVNMVPRSLWPGKPQIGIDYAIARGQGGGSADQAGINASISTGMIGQGVVNFGAILGPAAAALLMSIWVGVLARLDLEAFRLGRLPLYGSGLILTFNLGRDITLLVMYPLIFGAIAIWWLERSNRLNASHAPPRLVPTRR